MKQQPTNIWPIEIVEDSTTKQVIDELYTSQEIAKIDGISIPYRVESDYLLIVVLLLCFIVSSITLRRNKADLFQQFKNFVVHRKRNNIFDSSSTYSIENAIPLIIQTCALGGMLIYTLMIANLDKGSAHFSPHLLLLYSIVGFTSYIIIKNVVYFIIGNIFFNKTITQNWLKSYSILTYYLGFILFPIVLFAIYFNFDIKYIKLIAIILIVILKILIFYKWGKLFLKDFHGLILLILYFCALEVVPYLLIAKELVHFNNILLIKI